jgi:hypothetical protein
MAITGHKTEAVYRRYDIVAPEDLKMAGRKMENYLREIGSNWQQSPPEGSGKRGNLIETNDAGVAKLADARDSKSRALHWA